MAPVLLVAVGGAIGAVARYWVTTRAAATFGLGFPWGTLGVNVVGSLAMGCLAGLLAARTGWAPFLMSGVLGGFTTFSAFSLDTLALIERGQIVLACAYVVASVVFAILGCALGLALVRGSLA